MAAGTLSRIVEIVLTVADKTGGAIDNTVDLFDRMDRGVKKADQTIKSLTGNISNVRFRNAKDILADINRVKRGFNEYKNSGTRSATQIAEAHRKAAREIALLNKELYAGLKPMRSLISRATSLQSVLAVAGAGFALYQVIQDTAQFDDTLRAAGATAKASSAELALMEEAARNMGETTRYTATQAAEALQMLSMAGFSVQESIAALPDVLNLASAGMMDIGRAADIVSNVLTGYGLEIEDLGKVNDTLVATFTNSNTSLSQLGTAFQYVGPIAKAAGYEFNETAALLGRLADAGYQGSKGGTVLRGALSNLLNETPKVSNKLKELNVNVKNSDGSLKSMSEIVGLLSKAGVNASDTLTLFGKVAGPGMAALISIGENSINDLNETLDMSAGTAKRVSEEMEAGLGGALRRTSSAWSEYIKNIGRATEGKVIEFLEQLINALTSTKDEVTGLISTIVDIAAVFLSWGVSIAKFVGENAQLIASIAALTVGIYALGAAHKAVLAAKGIGFIGMLGAFNFSAVVSGFSTMSAGITALLSVAKFAVTGIRAMTATLAATNPVLAVAIAALTAFTIAAKLFGDSSLKAAKAHQKLADTIGQNRKEYTDQANELRALQKVFSESKEGSEEYINAEERLAEILPTASVSVDDHGRVLAKIGTEYQKNTKALQEYLAELDKQNELDFALQLEAQAKAASSASDAIDDHRQHLSDWYGIQEEGAEGYNKVRQASQWFWRGLNKATGTYDKNISKTHELADAHKTAATGMNKLLAEALKTGYSVDELSNILERAQISGKVKDEVLDSYREMIKVQEEANRKAGKAKHAAEEVEKQAERTAVATKEQVEAQKKAIKELDKVQEEANRSIQQNLREMEQGYSELSTAINESARSQISAIDEVTEARIRAIRNSDVSDLEQIQKEAAAYKDAYRKKAEVIRNFVEASEKLLRKERQARLDANSDLDSSTVENDILNKRKASYQEAINSYRSMIDSMIQEEQRHLDAVRAAEEEKAALKLSVEDKIRNLRRKGMSEEEQYADRVKEINEKQSAAREALAEGDLERAKKLAEQAMALAESTQRAPEPPKTEPPKDETDHAKKAREARERAEAEALVAQSIDKSIKEINESHGILNDVLDQTKKQHEDAAKAIDSEKKSMEASLQEAQNRIDKINKRLKTLTVAQIEVDTSEIEKAKLELEEITAKLNELDGKEVHTYVTVHEQTVEAHSHGGKVGSSGKAFQKIVYDHSNPFLRRTGIIPDNGGAAGDNVASWLQAGEGILRREAMNFYGDDRYERLNAMQVPKEALDNHKDSAVNPGPTTNHSTTNNSTVVRLDGIDYTARTKVKTRAQQLMDAVMDGR